MGVIWKSPTESVNPELTENETVLVIFLHSSSLSCGPYSVLHALFLPDLLIVCLVVIVFVHSFKTSLLFRLHQSSLSNVIIYGFSAVHT